jgi:hypothetical protein
MSPVFQFFRRPLDVFDPAMLTILGEAYDKALASLRYRGQPPIVRETIAVRIFELASEGERDPERLCDAALTALGSRL